VTIRDTLDKLPTQAKRQLMYAFEHELSQYVELDHDVFIGVNVGHLKNLDIQQTAGLWSMGKIKMRVKI
jgi:hypothetical protein